MSSNPGIDVMGLGAASQRCLCHRCPMWECGSLSRGEEMSKFKPDGRRTVIPRIITDDVAGLVRFLKTVFGAGGEPQSAAPTEMTMGDSVVMISDGGGAREAMPAFLYVYVQNADETYERAIAAGAESIEKPTDMPYGDRRATVKDSWSNIWQIATYRER
jgi:PhnB protein